MMHVERADLWLMMIFAALTTLVVIYRPSVEDIHSLVEMANTRGGIILLLAIFTVLFFVAGLRLSYYGMELQLRHPGDPTMAYLNSVFNWISGGAFMGAFGAMIATMKGEALPGKVVTESTSTSTSVVGGTDKVTP